MPTILVAGGGTGGHVFPGLAVAAALQELADVEVIFAGTSRGLETTIVPKHGYALELLDVEPMKGGGARRAVRGALVAAKATLDARTFVRRVRPLAVLSVGGYAAGPAAMACASHGVPVAILEPNSALGLANRLLAPIARRAYVAWAETARRIRDDKTRLYGVPLRPGFDPRPYAPGDAGARRLLVLGGSQGAQALNERVPPAIGQLPSRRELVVVHQAGRDRETPVRDAYAKAGVERVTVLPFLDDVAEQMAAADVIVARSGAVTVAEIASIGRASILVPFPHAADDHQAKNAMSLAELGGAVCVRQEAAEVGRITGELDALLRDDLRRTRMADAARAHGRPNAAADIARDLLGVAGIGVRRRRIDTETMATAAAKETF